MTGFLSQWGAKPLGKQAVESEQGLHLGSVSSAVWPWESCFIYWAFVTHLESGSDNYYSNDNTSRSAIARIRRGHVLGSTSTVAAADQPWSDRGSRTVQWPSICFLNSTWKIWSEDGGCHHTLRISWLLNPKKDYKSQFLKLGTTVLQKHVASTEATSHPCSFSFCPPSSHNSPQHATFPWPSPPHAQGLPCWSVVRHTGHVREPGILRWITQKRRLSLELVI